MATDIFIAETDADIESCFPVFYALRPHLEEKNFLAQVRHQQTQSYQILALRDEGLVKSAAGFRFGDFLAWGKILYIDDLSTLPSERLKGYASALLDWLIGHARANNCQAVHLDTGYSRHAAHRVYLGKGLQLGGHHMVLDLASDA